MTPEMEYLLCHYNVGMLLDMRKVREHVCIWGKCKPCHLSWFITQAT